MKPRENLLSWQVFLTTAVTKNISKTSIELDMDLKTVSRIVKELESDLGFILFDRSCRPFKLTEGAEKILPLAKELLRIKNKIEYKVQDFLLKPTEIRLSLPVNMTRDDLFELMDKYASAHPNLKIRLLNDCDHKHLLDNETDVAMLPYLPQNDEDEMVLFDAGFSYNMLLASPEYIRRNGAPQSLDELKAHPLILRESRIYRYLEAIQTCTLLLSSLFDEAERGDSSQHAPHLKSCRKRYGLMISNRRNDHPVLLSPETEAFLYGSPYSLDGRVCLTQQPSQHVRGTRNAST